MCDKWITCPHCEGRTKCSCASCGTPSTYEETFTGKVKERRDPGICNVCHGIGKVFLGKDGTKR